MSIYFSGGGISCDHGGGKSKSKHVSETDAAGEVIAIRCRDCAKVLCLMGTCPGCGASGKLSHVEPIARYCSEDCAKGHAKTLSAQKAAKTKASKAAQAKLPGVD